MFPQVLTEGYRSFLGGRLLEEKEKYKKLADGQSPNVLLIGCCDSRVPPEVIFDTGPGEIFTIRNVANIVPPRESQSGSHHGTLSAIEYAVIALGVQHIVVLGHATCGGIKASSAPGEPLSEGNFVGNWVSLIKPAIETLKAKGDSTDKPGFLTRLEYASIEQSLENLKTYDFIRERVEKGELELHGAHFGIEKGELVIRNPETGEFESVVESDGRTLRASALIHASAA